MSLMRVNSMTSEGRLRIIAEGSYMYVHYYKLMFPYKHGILDPVYFISYNRGYLTFLGASVLAYLHLTLDDWSVIRDYHGEYQDQKLFNAIKDNTELIVKGLIRIKDLVTAVSSGDDQFLDDIRNHARN